MNCYIGYITPTPPHYQNIKYSLALNQISDYLHLQVQENQHLILNQTQSLLTLTLSCSSFTIVKNHRFLHSVFYHVTVSTQQQWQFFKICLQCLLILKQHSVSQIQIQMNTDKEQLKLKLQQLQKERNAQLARRLVSHLKNLYEQSSNVLIYQLQDLLYIIDKAYSKKLTLISLKILNSGRVLSQQWEKLKRSQIQIIQKFSQDMQLKRIVSQILQKISLAKRSNQQKNYNKNTKYSTKIDNNNSNKNNLNLSYENSQNKSSRMNTQQKKYTTSSQIKNIFFQLKQSNNLQRISHLISYLQIQQMDEKQIYKLDRYLKQIGQKLLKNFYNSTESQQDLFCQLYIQYLNFRKTNFPQDLIKKLTKRLNNTKIIVQLQEILKMIDMEKHNLKVSQVGIKMQQSLMNTAKDYIEKI